jgi:endonuclease/exonuclease/phosphatase family metal-dependent hydrolase
MSDGVTFPQIFKVMTWNLFKWKGVEVHDWPGKRAEGMRKMIETTRPDIICTQETSPEYLDTILDVYEGYKCIIPDDGVLRDSTHDTTSARSEPFLSKNLRYRRAQPSSSKEAFTGWLDEGNVIFDSQKFIYVSHGIEDIGIEECESRRPKRRLFWVRLAFQESDVGSSPTILICTAHLTWEGGSGKEQVPPYTNERSKQAVLAANAIHGLRKFPDEPVILAGDMNDSWHVPYIMKSYLLESADWRLNFPTEPTHPARPCFHEERIPSQTRDWIFASPQLVPILSRVCSDMILGTGVHPSDHYPVLAVYQCPYGRI